MIVHASIDENGKVRNGKAGDQTGKEVCIRSWYDKGWNVCLRFTGKKAKLERALKIAIKLANSGLVGYDQYNRNSLYAELKKNDYNAAKYILTGVKTETDCSAFMYAVWACVIPEMRMDGNAPTTSTMKAFFKKHGFEVLTDKKYLLGEANLKDGDVLVKEGSHTAMYLDDGSHEDVNYYNKYNGQGVSLVDALQSLKVDSNYIYRKRIAEANGISDYVGTDAQNSKLLNLLKQGMLIKPKS